MDALNRIKQPIEAELQTYKALFDEALTHENDFLGQALSYVRRRKGKMMRPQLVLLTAKEQGEVTVHTQRAAVALELLHTASLVHDDVVDESAQRRGQQSVNALYDNKVAVLVGDYLLSIALQQAAMTQSLKAVDIIARLGGTLSAGEVFQLDNIHQEAVTEEAYFHIIAHKTAALFAACGELGALTACADEAAVQRARELGQLIGMCFQIRDDIFDYETHADIGKPTGNDMAEGKLTLPAIYALQATDRSDVHAWAAKVKAGTAQPEEIAALVDFTRKIGGMDYAKKCMLSFHAKAAALADGYTNSEVRQALHTYIDYVIDRKF